ncbi:MAG: hypothetical protein JNK15_24080 [Planctomycetes bacterium]|nr:hypothetical protein [Planctomycetota bacterium]
MRIPTAVLTGLLALTSSLDAAPQAEASHSSQPTRTLQPLPSTTLPQAITSFGACRSHGCVWIYGGHIGREHVHSRANVVGTFLRLDGTEPSDVRLLPPGPALQGTALVAGPDGRIWRVGGLSARNEPEADADLHSTASVACFDPGLGVWNEATPLPEPRSSHDAVVLGHDLYVVGGWHLHGSDDGDWHATAWRADLRHAPLQWQPVASPALPRRAAALATLGERLVLLGGLGEQGMLDTVEVFDVATGTWSAGPALPGSGFGTAATELDGAVYATVADGRLVRWDGTGPWSVRAQLATPRFFHRLLPAAAPGRLLALGGAGRGGHTRTTETVRVQPDGSLAYDEWTITAPGMAAMRQSFLLRGNQLWAFGGNRGGKEARFEGDQIGDDVWRIDLLNRTAERVATMPANGQSMAVAATGRDGFLFGGLGTEAVDDGGEVQSLRRTWRWDAQARRLAPFAPLPEPRTQCQALHHRDRLWVFGGTDFVPDAAGGRQRGDGRAVFVCDPGATAPAFALAELRLPRPRRSFGLGRLGDDVFLVGGLGEGFAAAGPADVLDFATGTWRELQLPLPWVSPQVATIGDRLYVACGGTMAGQRFTADRALWSWRADTGWTQIVAELPFATRNVHMVALRNRLLFVATDGADRDRIVVRTIEPDAAVVVTESAMGR